MKIESVINRGGRFTSSQIHKLIKTGRGEFGFGAPALTYIEECQIERRMKSCLDVGGYSQAMAWGNFMERVVFDHLGLEWRMTMFESKLHPDEKYLKYWSGSADLLVPEVKVGEIKCYQKKKFALLTDVIMAKDIDRLKDQFPEEYWQVVSNAVINDVEWGELITFMPYESELEAIREIAADTEMWGADAWKYRFIYEKPAHELAVLPDGGYYKNLNSFEFLIPNEDVELLEERVDKAIELLTRDESPKDR